MNVSKVLLSMAGLGFDYDYDSYSLRRGYVKFKYAGLSKRSPSHAQQKRDSKKAKNRRGK